MVLALTSVACGNDKATIDAIVKNILEPRQVEAVTVRKSPFVDGDSPAVKLTAPAKKNMPQLELQGIVNKKALINGRLYQVGDTVEGYQIQAITEKGVTLLKNGILYAAKLAASGSEIQIKRDR